MPEARLQGEWRPWRWLIALVLIIAVATCSSLWIGSGDPSVQMRDRARALFERVPMEGLPPESEWSAVSEITPEKLSQLNENAQLLGRVDAIGRLECALRTRLEGSERARYVGCEAPVSYARRGEEITTAIWRQELDEWKLVSFNVGRDETGAPGD